MFDGASTAIAFKHLLAFDGLRGKLGEEVVGLEDQGLEPPPGRDGARELVGNGLHTHVCLQTKILRC